MQILFDMKVLRKLFFIFLIGALAVFLFSVGFYAYATKDVKLIPEKLLLSGKNVTLYSHNGSPTSNRFCGGITELETLEAADIPKHTRLAFINTEDRHFYTHKGFDGKRIVRAAFNNLKSRSFKEGASTISQQLIKNTHLSQEKTVTRKLQEWKLTRALEKSYTKNEILEKYLNVIYFGHRCFGLRSAAKFYFNKQPNELDLADSAILAGLVKSPNNYSPFKKPENCLKRKESVLNAMLKCGSITQEEKQAAMQKELPLSPTVSSRDLGYAHFVFDELSALAEEHGFTVGGRIEIYTYLDENLQDKLLNTAEKHTQSGITLLALDNQMHGFAACYSTVGDIRRLPGSLLKPLLVYSPALEENLLSPATPILDEKISFGEYSPENFDNQFHGHVSVRTCVEKSLNVPAVKTLNTLGVSKAVAYLDKMLLNVNSQDRSLALALGGMQNGYTLQELTAAYSTLANQGNFIPCGFISRIDIDGKNVYRNISKSTRVFSEDTAYLMTDMLCSTAKTGTAKKLRSLPISVAAKTGTVGTDKGNTDAYAMSYTPKHTVSAWLGNADNTLTEYTGGGLPCNYLADIYQYLAECYRKEDPSLPTFDKPKNVMEIQLDKTSYQTDHVLCLADENAPLEYRFEELFKKSCIPKNKSEIFSNPKISIPVLQYENGKVQITFDKHSPSFYQYKIERFDENSSSILYEGKYVESFIDKNVEKDKKYVYTVTPSFRDIVGKAVVLPTVSTKSSEAPPLSDKEIITKNWWEY